MPPKARLDRLTEAVVQAVVQTACATVPAGRLHRLDVGSQLLQVGMQRVHVTALLLPLKGSPSAGGGTSWRRSSITLPLSRSICSQVVSACFVHPLLLDKLVAHPARAFATEPLCVPAPWR